MNPENRVFSNHEEEKNENTAENKEKNERINLSFVLASDLVKQIKSGEELKLNDYQKTCEYAVIYNKKANLFDTWDLVDDGFSDFLEELPVEYEKSRDENMKIFFCSSQYDIPLHLLRSETESKQKKPLQFLTPDGFEYKMEVSKEYNNRGKIRSGVKISHFDQKRLSSEEIKSKIEQVNNKWEGHQPFADYWKSD